MSELFDRVKTLPNICGIELAMTGELLPATVEGYQEFYNSITANTDFTPAYFGRASVGFDEESAESAAGISFKQKLAIRFPSSDKDRALRISSMHRVRYAKIILSNGLHIVIGRNDFEQNARPKIKTKTDERLAQVEFETVSIFPSGFTPAIDQFGLPVFFPISFISG